MRRIAVDISSLRVSRDLRLLVLGNVVSGLGTQAALVALPFQVYSQTGSAFLTGLLGAVELSVYHAGAEGTGLLFASVSAGATVAALTTGWLPRARRLGLIVIWAVVVWGLAIALAGLAGSIAVAALVLAVAGPPTA